MFVQSALDIGKVIGNARSRLKLTQSELARALGTSQNWVSEIESGKPTAQIGKVLRALSHLGVKLQVAQPSRVAEPATANPYAQMISLDDVIQAHTSPRGRRPKAKR